MDRKHKYTTNGACMKSELSMACTYISLEVTNLKVYGRVVVEGSFVSDSSYLFIVYTGI